MLLENYEEDECGTILEVKGKMLTPFKLLLSKPVYEQILKTLDNITPGDVVESEGSTTLKPSSVLDMSASSTTASETSTLCPGSPNINLEQPMFKTDKMTESKVEDDSLGIKVHFSMPMLCIRTTGDLGEEEKEMVYIKLEKFHFDYCKFDYVKTVDISLHSLVVEDLLQDASSKHK